MNISPIYLVEPYNAYAPKNRKKHPLEILEEQQLLERIMAEQIAQQKEQNNLFESIVLFQLLFGSIPHSIKNLS